MKKVLITGISGFVGHYLTSALQESLFEIHGTVREIQPDRFDATVTLHEADLLKKEDAIEVVKKVKPDFIYHLAALTSPAESFKQPLKTIHDNTLLQLNILEAVREAGLEESRMLVTSSAEVYGKVEEKDLPLNEESPMRPTSPYGVSKITQDYLAFQNYLAYNMNIIRVRPFNHIGPGQTAVFVVPAFAKQIAEIEKGNKEPILKVGNLEAKRDFTDVRDIVRAYVMLMEKGKSGEVYNIGSGKSHKIQEILDMLLGMSKTKVQIVEDPNLLRPSDIPETRCDNTKITKTTGWTPEIPIEQSLEDVLNYWRETV